MIIEWMDERENVPEDEETKNLVEKVMQKVVENEGIDLDTLAGVTLVEPERIREINREFRAVDSVTDVLSFPTIEGFLKDAGKKELLGCTDPETGAVEIGDLVICVERAKEQAGEYGHSLRREIGYLSAHGTLHLLGYDHETEDERAVMREKEEKALAECCLTRED